MHLPQKEAESRQYFDPMLAQSYDDRKSSIESVFADEGMVYCQPKLDGIRCIVRKEGDEVVARTRNGRTIDSIPHIIKSVEKHFDADDSLVLDGELYNHELKHDFNKIVSLVRSKLPLAPNQIQTTLFRKNLTSMLMLW